MILFRVFDIDKNGYISKDELCSLVNTLFHLIPDSEICVGWLSPLFDFAFAAWFAKPLLTTAMKIFLIFAVNTISPCIQCM